MSYLGELRQNIRPLAAASLGVGSSLPLFAYTNSVFAPFLIKEFGWSRSQFALVGLTLIVTMIALPFIGRLTDRLGVRPIALLGTALLPFCFIAYSQMQGSFLVFVMVFSAVLLIASMTSAMVYTRLIAENFERARGLALTIVNCAPAVLAMAAIPFLNISIEKFGWRTAYLALGLLVLALGAAALLVIPRATPKQAAMLEEAAEPQHRAWEACAAILRNKVTIVLVVAFFLCLLQVPLHATQMSLMLLDNGITAQSAANIVSVYAFGTIVGRILCGLALDRFSAPLVSAISMGLPAIGYLVLATNLDGVSVIVFAMFTIGLSVGAESDLFAFLVARYYKLRIYNLTLSLLTASAFLASAAGAVLASAALQLTDSFSPLLYLIAVTVTVGSAVFLLLPKSKDFEKIG